MTNDGPPFVLIVPELDNSGPDHWQSLWQERRDDCRLFAPAPNRT